MYLQCVDLPSGKSLWKKEALGSYHAGLIRTGDGKLLTLDDSGTLRLIKASATDYRELCRAKVCGGTLVNAALANGRAYVRDDKEVICVRLVD